MGDLKAKRKEIASLKGQIDKRTAASVAEVGHQDSWQRSTLAATVVSGSMATLTAEAERVERLVVDRHPDTSWVERRIVSLEDLGL